MKYIHILVLLTQLHDGKQIYEAPEDPKSQEQKFSVDHINGLAGKYPHRLEKMRWADATTQNQNRFCL